MNEEKKKILQMLSEGKIKAEEAALLLEQLESPRREDAPGRTDEKMLRVRISASEPGRETPVQVAVNLPLKAARLAGQILPSLIPRSAREESRARGDADGLEMAFGARADALSETGGDIVRIETEGEDEKVLVRVYVE